MLIASRGTGLKGGGATACPVGLSENLTSYATGLKVGTDGGKRAIVAVKPVPFPSIPVDRSARLLLALQDRGPFNSCY